MRAKSGVARGAVGVAACGALWTARRGSDPRPPLPSPNAYDDYVAAGRAQRDASGRPIIRDMELYQAQDADPNEELLKQAEPALRRLRQGFTRPYMQPPLRSFQDWEHDPTRQYSSFRQLSRLLVAEGNAKQERGDSEGAARSYLDGVRLGVDIAHGASLIGAFVGMACETIACRPLWKALAQMDAATARRAAREMETLEERRVPLHQALLEEKWSMQAILSESDPGIERGVLDRLRGEMARSRTLSDYGPIIDAHVANARLPYASPKPAVPAPTDRVSAQFTSPLARAHFNFAHNQAQSALLRVSLAMHAYSKENGSPPRSLAALVPKYLKSVPLDPFAINKALQLKVMGGKRVLYSIGPDGRDDGGQAIVAAARLIPSKQSHRVLPASRGDIVAGVNK